MIESLLPSFIGEALLGWKKSDKSKGHLSQDLVTEALFLES